MRPPRIPCSLVIAIFLSSFLSSVAATASESQAAGEPAKVFRGPRELPEFARAAWAATVFVETRSLGPSYGDRDLATGSGVVIAYDSEDDIAWIATSAHVVACDAACLIRVVFPQNPDRHRSAAVRARRVWHDSGQDLALLRASLPPVDDGREPVVRIAHLAKSSTATGNGRVLAIGYPDPSLLAADSGSRRAKLFSDGLLIDIRDGFQSDYRAYSSTVIEGRLAPESALLHTAKLLPGSSGGPLIDSSGAVLGINTGSVVSTKDPGCVRAANAGGERCLSLAVTLDAALDRLGVLSERLRVVTDRSSVLSCVDRQKAVY